jgi:predicted  nucleic acid-binding Zn-ribbon protein
MINFFHRLFLAKIEDDLRLESLRTTNDQLKENNIKLREINDQIEENNIKLREINDRIEENNIKLKESVDRCIDVLID